MRLWLRIALLCVGVLGCASPKGIIPEKSVTASIHTIRIVAVEGLPVLLYAHTDADKAAVDAMLRSPTAPASATGQPTGGVAGASLVNAPVASVRMAGSAVAIFGGLALLSEATEAGKEVPGEVPIFVKALPSAGWMPSAELAKSAAALLKQSGGPEVSTINGYVKVPIQDQSITWHMENWAKPLKRFYASDESKIDYATIEAGHVDAVLEVAAMLNEYFNEDIWHSIVFVRLIDPRTKRVLARALNSSTLEPGALSPLLNNDGAGLKRLVQDSNSKLLAKCLAEIRLTP
jgi:hypothetical protein